MKDDLITTSPGIAQGCHICPTCGKETHWQGEEPECWCKSLIERVAALEVWKAEKDVDSQYLKDVVESGQKRTRNQLQKSTTKTTVSPDGAHFIHSVSIDYLIAPQPAIDWEKVAIAANDSVNQHGWQYVHQAGRDIRIKEAKAAVAEYLRQVKEGAK